MKKLFPLLLLVALIPSVIRSTTSSFLQSVHAQVGFGTHNLSTPLHETAGGFYFARFEAPVLFENFSIVVEPRRDAGNGADSEVRWSGALAYKIF